MSYVGSSYYIAVKFLNMVIVRRTTNIVPKETNHSLRK